MSTHSKYNGDEKWALIAKKASSDEAQVAIRQELARFTATIFTEVGNELHEIGHCFGGDRVSGASPFGHGSDEVVAVSLLFRIAGQLTSAILDLFGDDRHYAAGALLRQMVEIEYLAWAFQTRDKDAERWLRSDANELRDFFKPAKLRQAAKGKFRGKDYAYHCELGGHPVPKSFILLRADTVTRELLISDLLGHTGRIWDHMLDWSKGNQWATPIQLRKEEMFKRYCFWRKSDELTLLPPPS